MEFIKTKLLEIPFGDRRHRWREASLDCSSVVSMILIGFGARDSAILLYGSRTERLRLSEELLVKMGQVDRILWSWWTFWRGLCRFLCRTGRRTECSSLNLALENVFITRMYITRSIVRYSYILQRRYLEGPVKRATHLCYVHIARRGYEKKSNFRQNYSTLMVAATGTRLWDWTML